MPRCCVLLANGFEEIEAVTVIDVLRRADVEVVTLGVEGTSVTGSHGIAVQADGLLSERGDEAWDLVVLPGGMPGAATLRDDERVQRLVAAQHGAGKQVAAICAAPIALVGSGALDGRQATSYPSFGDQLTGAVYRQDRVVADGHVTTSRGPGTALEFALTLVASLVGSSKADELAEQMLVRAAAPA